MPASKILSSINSDTKEEETEIITELLKRLQYSPTSILASERPDFEIELNGKLIGVEITKYYSDYSKKGSKIQLKISEWKKFAERLKARLLTIKSGYGYLYGAIHFYKDVSYKDLLKDKYFNELMILLSSVELKPAEQKTTKITVDHFPLLSKSIDSISLWNTYPENIHLWWDTRLQSGLVLRNEKTIQTIIDKKQSLSKNYKPDYFQKWLLIYAGGMSMHDIFVNVAQKDLFIRSKLDYFTHVLVWDKFTETIFQLLPYYKKIFDYGEKSIWVAHLPMKA